MIIIKIQYNPIDNKPMKIQLNDCYTLYSLYAFCIAAGFRPYMELGLEFVRELGGVASAAECSSSS